MYRYLLIIMVTGWLMAGCQEQQTASLNRVLQVTTIELTENFTQNQRQFHGVVIPADLTSQSFRINGKITQLLVQPGQQVKQGQLLAKLNDQLEQKQFQDAKAQFLFSQRKLRRAEQLSINNALSAAEMDQLQASFRLAKAKFNIAKAKLTYVELRAPFNGVIASVDKEIYETAKAGQTVLTIYRYDRLDVEVQLPDDILTEFDFTTDLATIDLMVKFDPDPTAYVMQYLKHTTERNPDSHSFKLWLSIPQDKLHTQLLPGHLATVLLAQNQHQSEFTLPITALQPAAESRSFRVWQLVDGKAIPALVQVDRLTQQGAIVSGELKPGAQIINSKLSQLVANQAVESVNPVMISKEVRSTL